MSRLSRHRTMINYHHGLSMGSHSPSSPRKNFGEDGPWPHPSIQSINTVYDEHANAEPMTWQDVEAEAESEVSQALVEHDPNARPKCFNSLLQELGFIFTVMMAVSCTAFVQGVIIINTATIGRSLHMTSAEITCIAAAIGLSSGSFMLFFGKTADLVGRKTQLLVGMIWLSLWSLVTAFAPNGITINVLCGFLGLGTACISPPAIGTLFATYPPGKRRNRTTGALGSANPLGFIIGTISSGLTTKYWNWRASFIFLAIFFFIIAIIAVWTMPAVPRQGDTKKILKQFDYLGTTLTIVGTGLVSLALTEGPEVGWKTASVIIPLVVGVVCIFGFAYWETIYKFPLLDPAIWRNKTFSLTCLVVFFGYGSFTTNQFWETLYMQDVQKFDPLVIAVRMSPQAIFGVVWSYSGQFFISRVNGTVLMGLGGLGYLIGSTLQIFVRETSSYWRFLFPSLVLQVLGADFQFIVSNLYVNKVMSSQASLGAGIIQTSMRLSISLCLAISTAIFGTTANSSKQNPTDPKTTLPYERAFLCTIIFSTLGVLLIPFMRVNTRDRVPKPTTAPPMQSTSRTHLNPAMISPPIIRVQDDEKGELEPKLSYSCNPDLNTPCMRHHPQYNIFPSQPAIITPNHHLQAPHIFRYDTLMPAAEDEKYTVRTTRSESEKSIGLTAETRSFLPRWSWEDEKEPWRRPIEQEKNVVYEVCIGCAKERKVVVVGPRDLTARGVRNRSRSLGSHGEEIAERDRNRQNKKQNARQRQRGRVKFSEDEEISVGLGRGWG